MKDIRVNDAQEFGDWIAEWVVLQMVKYPRTVSKIHGNNG